MFDTDKCVLVNYTGGSGGKFLINCLGLSNNALLQDGNLLNLNIDQKFDLIIERLNQVSDSWTDLDLGSGTLLGVERTDLWILKYFKEYDSLFVSNFLDTIHKTEKLFFLCTYSQQELLLTKKLIWPNAKIINFVNVEDFINRYRKNQFSTGDKTLDYFKNQWNEIKGSSWPQFLETVDQIENLEEKIKLELIDIIGCQNFKVLQQYLQVEQDFKNLSYKESIITWDVSWYFNENKTVDEIEKLYELFELPNFNEKYIRQYYQTWIKVLEKLKHQEKI